MKSERFSLDANILFYAVDRASGQKHAIATRIAARSLDADCILTLQALTEFFAAITRKKKMSASEAAHLVRNWMSIYPVVPPTEGTLNAALQLVTTGRASIWDATLIACLQANDCHYLLSEDMRTGSRLGEVEIVNPFTGSLPRALEHLLSDDE